MQSTLVNAIEVSRLQCTFRSNIGVIKRTSREIVAVDDVSFVLAGKNKTFSSEKVLFSIIALELP